MVYLRQIKKGLIKLVTLSDLPIKNTQRSIDLLNDIINKYA